ncbi:acyltransferase [Pectobacterium versatile]|uniref:acyltransferase family protein n=1 Tax=Pectobacterium versatile TaxID=2488639 RepID=UPI00301B6B5F
MTIELSRCYHHDHCDPTDREAVSFLKQVLSFIHPHLFTITDMKNEIVSLTSIRGVFAIYVVLYHMASHWNQFFRNGYLSVDLFFILSGFIMSYVYHDVFSAKIKKENTIKFYISRISRIYPLYIALTFVLICVSISLEEFSWPDAVANIFFIQVFFGNAMIGPSWSLSAEIIAYALFPFLFILVKNNKIKSLATSLLCLLTIFIIGLQTPGTNGPFDISKGWGAILRCISEYAIGVYAYLFIFNECKFVIGSKYIDAFSLLILSLLLVNNIDLIVISLFVLYIPVIARSDESSITGKLLSLKIMHYLGEISYSIYLWHTIILRQFRLEFESVNGMITQNKNLVIVIMFIQIIIISMISYHFIEKPAKKITVKHLTKMINKKEKLQV